MSRATIYVRFTYAGFHRWADAPERRGYLRYPHRHLFHAEVSCEVTHDDREIEFHDLQDKAKDIMRLFVSLNDGDLGSCEMQARHLGHRLFDEYGRPFTIDISEDGECGARLTVMHLNDNP